LDELGAQGQEIRTVANLEALPRLRRITIEKSSIILLVLERADVDELSLLKDIKKDEQLRKLPVVVLGPPNNTDLVNESFALGAAGYLASPAYPHELAARIQAVSQYWSLSELPK
jgi:CheY-like chemotaxis protein